MDTIAYNVTARQVRGMERSGRVLLRLPTNLQSPYVQQQTDGEIFYRTSFGYKRHPPMAYTVAEPDRWAIVIYIRSLANPGQPRNSDDHNET